MYIYTYTDTHVECKIPEGENEGKKSLTEAMTEVRKSSDGGVVWTEGM